MRWACEHGNLKVSRMGNVELQTAYPLHYPATADLRPFGISAIVHTGCRHGEGDHKLELLDTGQMNYGRMLAEVERVCRVDARGLDLMRIDLCADVEGVPVPWFHQHMRVKWKRWGCEHGKLEVTRMGNVELQTAYYGRRPNCIRVYDKVAEWRKEYAARRRGAGDTEFPSFEAVYAWPESGRLLTRVERQIGGGRVPAAIRQLGAAPKVLPAFNPFEPVDLAAAGDAALPTPEACDGIEDWLPASASARWRPIGASSAPGHFSTATATATAAAC